MARRLCGDKNELRITDNLSGSEIVLSYRLPTTKERVAYTAACIQRKGAKVINKSTETRIKYGKKILIGVRDGDFEVPGQGNEFAILSSDPESKGYQAGWKDLIEKYASDILELLSIQVFDVPAQIKTEDDDSEDDDIIESEDAEQD